MPGIKARGTPCMGCMGCLGPGGVPPISRTPGSVLGAMTDDGLGEPM